MAAMFYWRLVTLLFVIILIVSCAPSRPSVSYLSPTGVKGRLSETERMQLQLARMHFANDDFELARKEYIRLALNHPSAYVLELSHFMIGESYFHEKDWPQAERYFHQYVLKFPQGYKRAESEVRIQQCEEMRLLADAHWTTGKLRQQQPKKLAKRQAPAKKKRRPPAPRQTAWQQSVRTTWYWVVQEEQFARKDMVSLLDPNEQEIVKVPRAFHKRLLIEGTGRLIDGRIVNWAAPKRFMVVGSRAPFGLGAENRPLVPFRTVAVDRYRIPLGTILYIKAFDGVQLPGGGYHDGCFVAGDVGSAIKGKRIDLFAPTYEKALVVMRRVKENVVIEAAAKHCQPSYNIKDALATAF